MHKEILTKEQIDFLPMLKKFSKNFGLVGGTAIALHIGHRKSIDFDLFTDKEFKNNNIKRVILKNYSIDTMIRDEKGQYTFLANKVLFTFFLYSFKIDYSKKFNNIICLPDLLTLAAMKLYALGRRAKWKDYVDLYFIIKDHYPLNKIIKKSKQIFKTEFNEKICKEQLSYFDDINYSEKIVYKKGFEVSDEKIKKNLIDFSLS